MPIFFLFLLWNEPCPVHLVLKNGQTICLQKPFSVLNRHVLFSDQDGHFLQVSRAKVDLLRSGAHHSTPAPPQATTIKRQRQFPWHLPTYRHLNASNAQGKPIVVETEAVKRFGSQHPLPKPPKNVSSSAQSGATSALSKDILSPWGRPRKRVVRSDTNAKLSSETKSSNPIKRAEPLSKVPLRPHNNRQKR